MAIGKVRIRATKPFNTAALQAMGRDYSKL